MINFYNYRLLFSQPSQLPNQNAQVSISHQHLRILKPRIPLQPYRPVQTSQLNHLLLPSNQHTPSLPPGFRHVVHQSYQFNDLYSYNQPVSLHPSAPNPFPNIEIASPIPRRIQRFDFDPATLARDILLAFNKHRLQPQGLNSHLVPLQGRFGINKNSDLCTIRWDLLDPDNPENPNRPPNPNSEPCYHAELSSSQLYTR